MNAIYLCIFYVIIQSALAAFRCPARSGLYPEPGQCSHFYQCMNYIPYHKKCAKGLVFNPDLHVCDWPYNARNVICVDPVPPKPMTCQASGDVHYHTFDGYHAIDVQGSCMHTMARTCCVNRCQYGRRKPCKDMVLPDFHVMVQHDPGELGDVSFVKYAVVELCGCTVVLIAGITLGSKGKYSLICARYTDYITGTFTAKYEDSAIVRTMECPIGATGGPHSFTVKPCGDRCIELETTYGLKVKHSPLNVEVTIPSKYKSKMCGICGNADGNKDNDFITKAGVNVKAQMDNTLSVGSIGDYTIGNSWQVHNCDKSACTLLTAVPPTRGKRATPTSSSDYRSRCLAVMKKGCSKQDPIVLKECMVDSQLVEERVGSCRPGRSETRQTCGESTTLNELSVQFASASACARGK